MEIIVRQLFNGEITQGKRKGSKPLQKYKDFLKVNLKTCANLQEIWDERPREDLTLLEKERITQAKNEMQKDVWKVKFVARFAFLLLVSNFT